jgi:Galactose oxidase, central domain
MKLTQIRSSSHAFVILICCCIPIVFSATAARTRSLEWVQLASANSPPARSYLAMTYDPVSGKVIAFGGFDGTGYLNDTWTFDGKSWAQIAPRVSPPAREGAGMTYDAFLHRVILFGGQDNNGYFNDTWELIP